MQPGFTKTFTRLRQSAFKYQYGNLYAEKLNQMLSAIAT